MSLKKKSKENSAHPHIHFSKTVRLFLSVCFAIALLKPLSNMLFIFSSFGGCTLDNIARYTSLCDNVFKDMFYYWYVVGFLILLSFVGYQIQLKLLKKHRISEIIFYVVCGLGFLIIFEQASGLTTPLTQGIPYYHRP